MSVNDAAMRRKTLFVGVIYFNQRQQTVKCVVREWSAESATLICENANSIPTNVVELYIPSKNIFYPAAIQQRNGGELRVALTASGHNASREGGMAEVFRRLESLTAEVRKLRQMASEIKA